jgi:hypothetical protein
MRILTKTTEQEIQAEMEKDKIIGKIRTRRQITICLYARRKRQAHPEARRQHYKDNPEPEKAYSRKHYITHKEEHIERATQWRHDHPKEAAIIVRKAAARLLKKDISEIDASRSSVSMKCVRLSDEKIYDSMEQAAIDNHVSRCMVQDHCHRKLKENAPYRFSFLDMWLRDKAIENNNVY